MGSTGTKNATLKIFKDGHIEIIGKSEILDIESIENWYDTIIQLNNNSFGEFSVHLPDPKNAVYRVGCQEEGNFISLNEIKLVLDTYHNIK